MAIASASVAESTSAAETAAWVDFGSPQSQDEFLARWLALLCLQVGEVRSALLLVVGTEDNTFHAGAVWPDAQRDLAYLAPVAQQALAERRGVVVALAEGNSSRVAYPVEVAGELKAAIVLDAQPRSEAGLQQALRQVHWAAAWLVDLYRQQALAAREATVARLALVQAAVGAALQQRGFQAAAFATVNLLATRMGCDRVSLGRDEDGEAEIEAISNTASFDPRSNLARLIADAMDEALDAGMPVQFPAQGDARLGAGSHAALAADSDGASHVLSVLLVDAEGSFGVLTFERRTPFDDNELETCHVAGLLLGPLLSLAHDNERSLRERVADKLHHGAQALFGPRHPGVKLFTTLAGALLLVMAFVNGDYRVAARTVVEGEVQRATVVPFDGFLAESLVRAGDTVRRGQTMARLDDRDLKLEADRWRAEHGQYLSKYRQAQAAHDRAAMNVLGAQANQALAQLQLTNERLSRLLLTAPFDGLVVSGDLRQLIGTPLEQGKVLFETAPLDAYRVVLQVDERDIARLSTGQQGELVLAGLPGVPLAFTVHQITPVASAEDGRNFFRVEADVAGGAGKLKPGMEGVGKVNVGERRLLWIWTHSLVDWLRLALWRWWP
jgi:multidrug resistance efflux pump